MLRIARESESDSTSCTEARPSLNVQMISHTECTTGLLPDADEDAPTVATTGVGPPENPEKSLLTHDEGAIGVVRRRPNVRRRASAVVRGPRTNLAICRL